MDHMRRVLKAGLFLMIALVIGSPAGASDIVAFHAGAGGITIRPLVPFEFGTLTVGTPDGLVFRQELAPGSGVSFNPLGQPNYQAPDGTYIWQVTLGQPSTVHPRLRAAARANRGGNGDPDIEAATRAATERATMIQSGAFTILGGAIVPSDLVESGSGPKGAANTRPSLEALRQANWFEDPAIRQVDQVIPDDLIVQGSACIGLDCVNNESFGFDTIRLKENNTRIKFEDTSVGSFPTNDWQLTANDSASGASSKFSIEDITGSRVPFTITAGASTNSIFVDSTGRVGFRTSTPVLDLHINTSNTPAIRLEQNNSGGFTAQTWDIGANEANFFVRDVTGGSKLSFRIRPGAPTSSLDISSDGDIGMGTASPNMNLDVRGTNAKLQVGSDTASFIPGIHTGLGASNGTEKAMMGVTGGLGFVGTFSNTSFGILTNNSSKMFITGTGNVGIGTTTPAQQLHTTGSVRLAGIVSCTAGLRTDVNGDVSCLPSTRELKIVTGDLAPQVALANVMSLRPQMGAYKATPDEPEHWLIAEDTAAVDPALVGYNQGKPFTVKTQNVVADLIAVVQQQQRRIEDQQRFIDEQQKRLEALERANARR